MENLAISARRANDLTLLAQIHGRKRRSEFVRTPRFDFNKAQAAGVVSYQIDHAHDERAAPVAPDRNFEIRADDAIVLFQEILTRKTLAALEAHLKTAHIGMLLAELGDLLAGPPEVRVLLPAGD